MNTFTSKDEYINIIRRAFISIIHCSIEIGDFLNTDNAFKRLVSLF